jgi:hypothetical protein
MIARNYIQHPEALRFQLELFVHCQRNGKKTSKFGRLMSAIFEMKKVLPQWWKDLKKAEGLLIKSWREAMVEMFGINDFVTVEQ